MQQKKWYQAFRWFFTSHDFLVVGGKNAEQNEMLMKNYLGKKDIILHTKLPGSSFCIIKARKKISTQDAKEAAIFCACFSQQWKKHSKEVEVHIFKHEQIFKEPKQKTGTFSVLGKVQKVFIVPELWLGIQKGKLRATPKNCLKKPLLKLLPGKIPKEKAIGEIKERLKKFNLNEEEIAQAIPAGGFSL